MSLAIYTTHTHQLAHTLTRRNYGTPTMVICSTMFCNAFYIHTRAQYTRERACVCMCVRITIKLLCTLVPAVKSLNQKLLLHYAHFFFSSSYSYTHLYITRVSRPQKYTHKHACVLFRHHQTKPDIAIVSKKTIQTMQL